MRHCPNCRSEMPESATYCPSCGRGPGRSPEKKSSNKAILAVVFIAMGVGALGFCGIVSAIAVPNFLNAVDRGKQKRTMIDIRTMGAAVNAYAAERQELPDVDTIDELVAVLSPDYLENPLTVDGWGFPLLVDFGRDGYVICSRGKDGLGDCDVGTESRTTSSFDDSIIFVDGEFVQWPEGFQQ